MIAMPIATTAPTINQDDLREKSSIVMVSLSPRIWEYELNLVYFYDRTQLKLRPPFISKPSRMAKMARPTAAAATIIHQDSLVGSKMLIVTSMGS
jgi:hypothetical protein